MASHPDATTILRELENGDRPADDLLPLVYDELHLLADSYLRRERVNHTLVPTALVHEAYLRLIDQDRVDWQGCTHFKAVAAIAMQRALIDHARGKNREKRGGGWRRVTLDDAFHLTETHEIDAMELHDALTKMHELDERQARVAELRLYGGLSADDTAAFLDVSSRTVERDWKMAQAWLRRELAGDGAAEAQFRHGRTNDAITNVTRAIAQLEGSDDPDDEALVVELEANRRRYTTPDDDP